MAELSALIIHTPVPVQAESLQGPQDIVGRAGHIAGRIDIIDSD